jgi:hypothetical protein
MGDITHIAIGVALRNAPVLGNSAACANAVRVAFCLSGASHPFEAVSKRASTADACQ